MNINFLKKFGIFTISTIGAIYALFLIAPFVISPIANNYIPIINDEIKKVFMMTGFFNLFEIK